VLAAAARALKGRPVVGALALVGQVGIAREALAPSGQVAVQGEIWRAVTDGPTVDAGAPVRVVAVDGLTLRVAPVDGVPQRVVPAGDVGGSQ
jgi:membrane-bound serine protease (ClpP class)